MNFIKKLLYLGLLTFLALNTAEIVKAEQDETRESYVESDFVPGQVIVGMKSNSQISPSALSKNLFSDIEVINVDILTSESKNVKSSKEPFRQILLLELADDNKQSVIDSIQLLEEHPDVEYAEPNYVTYLEDLVEEELDHTLNRSSLLWNLERIQVPGAWEITEGNPHIKVGIIDTGIDHNHPNLSQNVNTSLGYNFTSNNSNAIDEHGHGTHIAGIIGSYGSNTRNVSGVSPFITMVSLKVHAGWIDIANTIRAVNYANEIGLDILNFSIGLSSQALADSVRAFNGLFVAAAGNSNRDVDQLNTLGQFGLPNLIMVGNSNQSDQRHNSSFDGSSYGRRTVDLFAPGTSILSTDLRNTFSHMTGTSMAAPHVVGAAALALSVNPSLTPEQLKAAINHTVDPVPALANLCITGGRLNVEKLLNHVRITPSSEGIEYSLRTTIHCEHPWPSKSGLEHCHTIYLADISGFTGSQKNVLIPGIVENHTVQRITTNEFANKGLVELDLRQLANVNQISPRAFEGNPLQNIIVPRGHANPQSRLFNALRSGMQGVTSNAILREGPTPRYQWNGVDNWIPIN